MAAKRWLAAHGQRYGALDAVYLGDDLFSRQPLCQAVLDAGGHFIFVCKPSSHPLIQEYLSGADLPLLVQTVKRGKQRFVYRYRWLRDVPLRNGSDALMVNWFEIEIINARGRSPKHAAANCLRDCRLDMPATLRVKSWCTPIAGSTKRSVSCSPSFENFGACVRHSNGSVTTTSSCRPTHPGDGAGLEDSAAEPDPRHLVQPLLCWRICLGTASGACPLPLQRRL